MANSFKKKYHSDVIMLIDDFATMYETSQCDNWNWMGQELFDVEESSSDNEIIRKHLLCMMRSRQCIYAEIKGAIPIGNISG